MNDREGSTMPDASILRLEVALAAAHRATIRTHYLAQDTELYGLADDLWSLSDELAKLLEDLLSGKPHLKESRI